MDYLHLPEADGDAISTDGVSEIQVNFGDGESPPSTGHQLLLPGDFEDAASTSLLFIASESPSPVAEAENPGTQQPTIGNCEASLPREEMFMEPEESEEAAETLNVATPAVDAEAQSDSSSSNQSPEASSAHLLHHNVIYPPRCQVPETIPSDNLAVSMAPFLKRLDCPQPTFVYWNWPLIRKMCLGSGLTGVLALLGVCIAMLMSLPRHCDPPTAWWQGSLTYEVFPASFKDSDGDGVGDLQGLESRLDYIRGLGARSIRLNGLFPSKMYPERYSSVKTLLGVAPELGTMESVAQLAETCHQKNLSLMIDIPVEPMLRLPHHSNASSGQLTFPYLCEDMGNVLKFWLKRGVDGFYLKDMELVAHEPQLAKCFGLWRQEVDSWGSPAWPKVLMASAGFMMRLDGDMERQARVVRNLDMVDAFLALGPNLTKSLSGQLEALLEANWAADASSPWINWNLGSASTPRLGSRLGGAPNTTLAAQLVLLSLPGSVTLFYGDELGALDSEDMDRFDPDEDESEGLLGFGSEGTLGRGGGSLAPLAPLAPLAWDTSPGGGFTKAGALPWAHLPPASQRRNVQVVGDMLQTLADAALLRESTAALRMNGDYDSTGHKSPNFLVRHADDAVVLLERWYTRRPRMAVVANLDPHSAHQRSFVHSSNSDSDGDSGLMGGAVVVGTHRPPGHRMDFSHVHLAPGEAAILRLYA